MAYTLIVIVAVVWLTLYYVVATTASWISKVLVAGILGFCLGCFFWWHKFGLAALFLMVGLGIFISVYRICVEARFSDRRK